MTVPTTDLEARIRAALKERLGETMMARFHRHNDTLYLEIAAPLGLERIAKSVEQALDSIGSLVRSEKVALDVTISSPWQPRWRGPATVRPSAEPELMAAPGGRRATG